MQSKLQNVYSEIYLYQQCEFKFSVLYVQQALIKAIALRRTKDMQVDGKRLVELPRKTISMHYVELTPEDRELYDKVEESGKEVIERFMRSGTVLQNYATVLQIILRLRQICNHSGLCPAYTQMFAGELNQKGKTIISFHPSAILL